MAKKKESVFYGENSQADVARDVGGDSRKRKIKQDGMAHYEKSSPELLAAEPNKEVKSSPLVIPQSEWKSLESHLSSLLSLDRTWRESWWSQNYSGLSEYLLPRRSIWLTQTAGGLPTANNMNRGREINQSIVDPTGTLALRIASGGLMTGMASPSRPWFKVTVGQEVDAAGKLWIDQVESVLYGSLANSNFYNSFAQECEDLLAFGTAPVIIYEDESDVLRFYNPACGEYFLGNSPTNRVDRFERLFVMTVQAIVDFFGLENCTKEIQDLWAQKGGTLAQERVIAHSIEPNFAIGTDGKGKIPGGYTWREAYWVYGGSNERPLSLRGFHDKPFTAARWSTQSNDAYGRSPGMDVLPDIKQLQVMTRRKAEAIEKQVRPPLLADAALKNQPASQLPGHVTYVQNLGAGTGMRPIYTVQPDISAMMNDIAAIQQRIKTGLFNDVFMAVSGLQGDRRTATEIAARQQEAMQVLGPIVEGLICDSLKPKLTAVYSILKKRGKIPPAPDSMKGLVVDVEFVSILSLAQKSAAIAGIERQFAFIGNAVAVWPEAKDNMDIDAASDLMNQLLGNPEKIIIDAKVRDAKRQAQAKAMQDAQHQQAMGQGAQTIAAGAKAAKVLSDTQIGGGASALGAILGTGGT